MKISDLRIHNNDLPKINDLQQPKETGFGNLFSEFVKDVNSDQNSSQKVVQDFINGEDIELHEVMVAGEKAKTSLDLLMEIRNKSIDMYKELTRMQ